MGDGECVSAGREELLGGGRLSRFRHDKTGVPGTREGIILGLVTDSTHFDQRVARTMLLTITTTHTPATDIGFLLEKHPEKVHEYPLSAGRALVFYPEATQERCTAALLLDIASYARRPPGERTALSQSAVVRDETGWYALV